MPRQIKYDEIPFEKSEYSNKVFIYNEPKWNVLFPIVELIRAFDKHTILSYKYGPGSQIIKLYNYNHLILGYDLKNKNDYKNLITAKIKFIFIFTDSSDIVATNLINIGKTHKIPVICYSNIDHVYHFYENDGNLSERVSAKVIENVIQLTEYIEMVNARKSVSKLAELFPEFEIIDLPEINKTAVLDDCVKLLKIKSDSEKAKINITKKFYDPNLNKLKRMEYERNHRHDKYEDDIEDVNKAVKQMQLSEQTPKKNALLKFFSKKI